MRSRKKRKPKSGYRITVDDFLRANRKASREEEIAAHGKQISFRTLLRKSANAYDRKRLSKVVEEE